MAGILALLAGIVVMSAAAGAAVGDCPSSPNCVSSRASDPDRRVPPIRVRGAPGTAWEKIIETVAGMRGATIVRVDDRTLEAQFKSRLFRFVDDFVLELDAGAGEVHLFSASRTGYWDLGVNRRRVERFAAELRDMGIAYQP